MSSGSGSGSASAAAPALIPVTRPGARCVFDDCPFSIGYVLDPVHQRHVCFMHLLYAGLNPEREQEVLNRGMVYLVPGQRTTPV